MSKKQCENVNKGWSNQITNIRALAILLVVFGHSIILYSKQWGLYETTYEIESLNTIKRFVDIIQMPIFFSISGYLFFITHRKKRGIRQLLYNKTKRLLVPYVITGLGYMLPIKILLEYKGYEDKNIFELIIKFLKVEDVGHLWFLPALFIIFLICELLLNIIEIIPLVNEYSSVVMFAFSLLFYFEGYRISAGYAPILSAFAYMIWFVLGYILCEYRSVFMKIYKCKIFGIFSVVVMCNLFYIVMFCETRIFVQLMCKSLFIINLYMFIPTKENTIVNQIANNSFGIYLLHSPLIYFTYTWFANAKPVIVVFVNFVVFGYISLKATEKLKRTKIKFILGE